MPYPEIWSREGEYINVFRWKLLEEARAHLDLRSGFPIVAEPGECEICDILWLIEQGEGDLVDNIFHLRDAMAERPGEA